MPRNTKSFKTKNIYVCVCMCLTRLAALALPWPYLAPSLYTAHQ